MSIVSSRSLTVASIQAIVVFSLSPLAGASPLYSQPELAPMATSDVLLTAFSGGLNLFSEIAPKRSSDDGSNFSFGNAASQEVFASFGSSVDRFTTAAGLELPSEIALVPFSTLGRFQFNPVRSSFTAAVATAPEPEGAGIAAFALLLVVGAFRRRLRRGSEAIRPL
jgi:MYXO-CTERM domain-containing protein